MAEQEMSRNVGTSMNPESFLHARAVALLYDELTRPEPKPEVRVRLTPGGDWSDDLRAGVESVKVPGEWDSVGGIVPDLILYGEDASKPLRIIEVVVSSPPDKAKQEKLMLLERRGVDVVVIKVGKIQDLMDLCRRDSGFRFGSPTPRARPSFNINIPASAYLSQQHTDPDRRVSDLIEAIISCSPPIRRQLCDLLNQLDTVDSLYPIRPTNPLKDKLESQ